MQVKDMDIIIISGFLGSGKTTFLKKFRSLLDKNMKSVILMNEFGEVDIDSNIIGESQSIKSMTQGCICCSLKEDLEVQLHELYYNLNPDLIIIEATGVADPVEIIDAISAPAVMEFTQLKQLITVVDSQKLLTLNTTPQMKQLFLHQIKYANTLILNKLDILTEDEMNLARNAIKNINDQAYIIESIEHLSEKDIVKFYDDHNLMNEIERHPSAHNIQSMTIKLSNSVEIESLHHWLGQLDDNIYRVKGFVTLRHMPSETYLLQYAFGIPQYEPYELKRDPVIVIIGSQIDKERIKQQIEMLQFS